MSDESEPIMPPLGDNYDSADTSSDDVVADTVPRKKSVYSAAYNDTGDLADLASVNAKLADKKIKIEELRFKLEQRRADHEMLLEMRREDFKEMQFKRDMAMLIGANEHWVKSYWRPAAGWVYLVICVMDFVIFPLISLFIPLVANTFGIVMEYTPWESLTLTQGGLIHLSFGAILGVSAWTRGKEKLAVVSKT